MERLAYNVILETEGQPNKLVTVYRAVEKDGGGKIIPGDWVTTVRQYAKEHGESNISGGYKILKEQVRARDLFTSGDSFLEYGYHPQERVYDAFVRDAFKKAHDLPNPSRPPEGGGRASKKPEAIGTMDNIVTQRPPVDQTKIYKWADIDQAIENAPDVEARVQVKKVGSRWEVSYPEKQRAATQNGVKGFEYETTYKKSYPTKAEATEAALKEIDQSGKYGPEVDQVVIQSPQGAVYRIWNTKETLSNFKAKVIKEFPGKQSVTLFSGIDPVAAYKSLSALKNDIQAALPHLEALGRRVYESGKTDLKSWAGAMKRTLGDLWDPFKDVMVRVWRTVSKPIRNEKGAVGDFESFRKAAKDGDVQAARREYERLRQEALTPVSGNKLDEAATGYLKTGNFQDYLDNMPTLGELKPQDIFKYDPGAKRYIASYLTGDGKLKPAIRQSGFHALRSFADYFKDKKDISKRDIMWVDPTRMIQGIDGGVMGGAAQQHILWPTRSTVLARLQWNDKQKGELARIQEARNIHSGKKAETVGDVVEYIEFKEKDGKVYIGGKVPRELLKDWKPGEQAEIIAAAKDIRRFSKKLLDDQNAARQRRGEKPIPYRSFYRPWVIKANLWSKLMGRVLKPSDVMEAAEAPDFINPNRPFNPREQAREGGLKNYDKERNIIRLMADYVDTAGKDIFNANIVHNNKIHAAILKAQNMENAAAAVNVWTAEAFGGVSPRITKVAREILPQPIHRGMLSLRRQLTRAVFPLNFLWNLSIQTSSAGVTYMRYGEKANLAGLRYLTDRQFNEAVKRHAYSAAVKARWGGSMSYQDVGQSLGKMRQLEASKIETAEHYANFLTQAIEDGLTGHAVAAAYYHGKKLGLTGRALWEYASEGGAKTQSMYNLEDAPGLLRAREVGAVAPFQTFAFEMFNTVREMNFPVLRNVIGKTGLYETMSASTAAGKAAMSNRLKMLARWVAACLVTNMVVEEETGRNPWGPSAFIPFYALTVGLVIEGQYTRGLPTPIQYGRDFKKGVTDVIEYGSFKRLRRWALRYHMVAGTQVERTLSGIEAVARGGVYDVRGRELFPVKGASEQVRAVAGGPWFTRAGIERLREKSARSLLGPTPEQDLSRKARTRRRPTRRRRAD
jgi:hypothetical protein